jgi:hypothetical protein
MYNAKQNDYKFLLAKLGLKLSFVTCEEFIENKSKPNFQNAWPRGGPQSHGP